MPSSATPGTSSRLSGTRVSGISRSASGAATRPTGTLSQKIHCQASPSTIAPPTSGPQATAIPVTALNRPSAAPRRSGGNAAVSSAMPSVRSTAAPAPCATRMATRAPTLPDTAQPAEARANSTSPPAYVRARPSRSPSTAAGTSSTAKLRL